MNTNQELTLENIQHLMLKFKNDVNVQKLKHYYYDKSFPEILSIGRRETSHSSFLAWLFNNNGNHQLGNFALIKLLEIVVRRSIRQDKVYLDSTLKNAILTDSLVINSLSVNTEQAIKTSSKKNGRIDIVMKANVEIPDSTVKIIRVIIENKISSNEHDEQTQTYFDYYEKIKSGNEEEINLYLYLTPISSLELSFLDQPECSCKCFIQINYQDVLDYILEPALENINIPDKTKFIITEYIQTLSQPSLQEEDSFNNNQNLIIMAIGEKERKLLTSFWENNETLILAAMNAISTDGNQDSEVSEEVKKVYNSLTKSSRDYSKFSINGQGSFNKRGLVCEIIKLYAKSHPDIKLPQLKEKFPSFLVGGNGAVIRGTGEVENARYYTELSLADPLGIIYVYNQWGSNNIDRFIQYTVNNTDIRVEKI